MLLLNFLNYILNNLYYLFFNTYLNNPYFYYIFFHITYTGIVERSPHYDVFDTSTIICCKVVGGVTLLLTKSQ